MRGFFDMNINDIKVKVASILEQDSTSYSDYGLWLESIYYAPPIELMELIIDIQAQENSAELMLSYDSIFNSESKLILSKFNK